MSRIAPRTAGLVAGVVATLVGGVLVIGAIVCPSNDDVLVHNATSNDILDVVVLRGEGADAEEIARFPRIAPDGRSLAHAGLGPISVEFSDSRGRWIAARALWRDEDDVRMNSEPDVLDVAADAVGRAPVRRRP